MGAPTTLVCAWAERARTRLWPYLLRALAWFRRTPAWMFAMLWFATGVLLGIWGATWVLSLPVLATPEAVPVISQRAFAMAEAASVAGPLVEREGRTVVLMWRVTNSGERGWDVPSYRFVPDRPDLPVVPLPRSVKSKETVALSLIFTLPEGEGEWRPVWHLSGPRGPIPGGELEARIELAGK